ATDAASPTDGARDGADDAAFPPDDVPPAPCTPTSADLRVTNAPRDSRHASLAWTGRGFGIAWEDARDSTNGLDTALSSQALAAAGQPVGANVRVTTNPAPATTPAVVWTGREYGLAWTDERDGNPEIYFTRLDAAGARVGSDVRVTNAPSASLAPALV